VAASCFGGGAILGGNPTIPNVQTWKFGAFSAAQITT
jgi:hypothetical protein